MDKDNWDSDIKNIKNVIEFVHLSTILKPGMNTSRFSLYGYRIIRICIFTIPPVATRLDQ